MKCQKCKALCEENTYFCKECGTFTETLSVQNVQLKAEYEKKMQNFIQQMKIEKKDDTEILWDSTINRYAQNIKKLQMVVTNDELADSVRVNTHLLNKMNTFINKCHSPEFHIAFVGVINAGKSTLINALLGKKLASTSVTPETAVLTKFRAAKNKNYVKLSFYNTHEWDMLWQSVHESKSTIFLEEYKKLNAEKERKNWVGREEEVLYFENEVDLKNEIEKRTSSKQPTHYFVKEVEVGLVDFKLPEQVVFVDTPGLDDAVRYRSDVTRRYIDRANAVFACIKADAMTGQELATLYRIFANTPYNTEKVYVIGTQWDTLNRPKDNWEQQKAEWVKYLKQDDCYGNEQRAEQNIIAVAAYIYNLIENYDTLDEDEMLDLESISLKLRIRNFKEHLEELKEKSNVDSLKHVLSTEIIAKYKNILLEDLKYSYVELKQDLQQHFEEVRNNNIKILQMTSSDLDQIQQERENSKKELEDIQQQRESLSNTLTLVRRSTDKRVDELCEQIKKLAVK